MCAGGLRGRIPKLKDFDDYGETDVCRIFDNASLDSYYKFLVKYEKEYRVRLSAAEEKMVEFIAKTVEKFMFKESGNTIVLASHNREDIAVLCDEITELDHGNIVG